MPKIAIGKNTLGQDILAEPVLFKTNHEEWNEYTLENGTVVRVKNVVTDILRTELLNEIGETIYAVRSQCVVVLKNASPQDKIAFGFD